MDQGIEPNACGGRATRTPEAGIGDLWVNPFEPCFDRNHFERLRADEIRMAFYKAPSTFARYVQGPLLVDKRLEPNCLYIQSRDARLYLYSPFVSLVRFERELPESCVRVSGSIICNLDAVSWKQTPPLVFRLGFGNQEREGPRCQAVYVKPGFAAAVQSRLRNRVIGEG